MKKLALSITVSVVLITMLSGCGPDNNESAQKWIAAHKKPIACMYVGSDLLGSNAFWTLIDADGNIYATGPTTLNLPDTIKTMQPILNQ